MIFTVLLIEEIFPTNTKIPIAPSDKIAKTVTTKATTLGMHCTIMTQRMPNPSATRRLIRIQSYMFKKFHLELRLAVFMSLF